MILFTKHIWSLVEYVEITTYSKAIFFMSAVMRKNLIFTCRVTDSFEIHQRVTMWILKKVKLK